MRMPYVRAARNLDHRTPCSVLTQSRCPVGMRTCYGPLIFLSRAQEKGDHNMGCLARCRAARFARGMEPDKVWQMQNMGTRRAHATSNLNPCRLFLTPCAHGPSRAALHLRCSLCERSGQPDNKLGNGYPL